MRRGQRANQLAHTEQALEPITPQQQTFIEHLLLGKTISASALTAGIARRTAVYWLRDLEHPVTIEYEKQVALRRQTFYDRLSSLQEQAMKTMEDALSESAPPALRLKAAMFIFENQIQHLAQARLPERAPDLVEKEAKVMRNVQHFNTYDSHHLQDLPD